MGDETGLRVYTEPPGAAHVRGQRRKVGDAVAVSLDDAIKRLLDEQHARARDIIEAHKEDLEKLVRELLVQKTLHRADVDKLLGAGAEAPVRSLDFLADLDAAAAEEEARSEDPDAGLGEVRASAVPDRPTPPVPPQDPEPPR